MTPADSHDARVARSAVAGRTDDSHAAGHAIECLDIAPRTETIAASDCTDQSGPSPLLDSTHNVCPYPITNAVPIERPGLLLSIPDRPVRASPRLPQPHNTHAAPMTDRTNFQRSVQPIARARLLSGPSGAELVPAATSMKRARRDSPPCSPQQNTVAFPSSDGSSATPKPAGKRARVAIALTAKCKTIDPNSTRRVLHSSGGAQLGRVGAGVTSLPISCLSTAGTEVSRRKIAPEQPRAARRTEIVRRTASSHLGRGFEEVRYARSTVATAASLSDRTRPMHGAERYRWHSPSDVERASGAIGVYGFAFSWKPLTSIGEENEAAEEGLSDACAASRARLNSISFITTTRTSSRRKSRRQRLYATQFPARSFVPRLESITEITEHETLPHLACETAHSTAVMLSHHDVTNPVKTAIKIFSSTTEGGAGRRRSLTLIEPLRGAWRRLRRADEEH